MKGAGRAFPRSFVFFILLLEGLILAGGIVFHRVREERVLNDVRNELVAVARLKADQIGLWRRERLGDGGIIMESPFLVREAERLFAQEPDAGVETIRTILRRFLLYYGYSDFLLLNPKADPVLGMSGTPGGVCPEVRSAALRAMETRTPLFVDLHETAAHGPACGVVSPLLLRRGEATDAVGAVFLRIDPAEFLYPMIQAWPVPSRTAETLLVRKDGDSVLFLNELRHRKETALRLRLPLDREDIPAAAALRGRTGFMRGPDYNGVPVLAVIEPLPSMSWFLIAKMSEEEAFAGFRMQSALIFSSVFGSMLLVLFVSGFFLQRAQKERYRAEADARRERDALLRHFEYLVRYANDIILLVDADERIVEANDRALEVYGYAREEMTRLRTTDFVAPENLGEFGKRVRLIGEEGAYRSEGVHRRKDGSTFPVEISARSITVDGRTFFQAIIRDITERKKAEAALRESEGRVRAKLDAILSPEGDVGSLELEDIIDVPAIQVLLNDFYDLTGLVFAIVDLRGKVLVTNGWQEICTRFHRVCPETCEGCRESDTVLSSGAAPGEFKLYKCRNGLWDAATPIFLGDRRVGNVFTGQLFFDDEEPDYGFFREQAHRYGFDEEAYMAAVRKVPRFSRERVGSVMRFYAGLAKLLSDLSYSNIKLARALTERERAEETIRTMNADLERRVLERTRELESATSEMEAFTYSVSHDLRAPLRAMTGFGQALSEDCGDALDERCRGYVGRICAAADRMGGLIDDLLMLSRISRSELHPERVDLAELARTILKELREAEPGRRVETVVPESVPVLADRGLARIVMDNLLRNAWKFTGKKPSARIEFGAARNGAMWECFVRDDGAGFDMEYAGKLFGPFQRLHRADEFPGSGIGLVTVQRIVRRHGGRIWADGIVDGGATFAFTMPAPEEGV